MVKAFPRSVVIAAGCAALALTLGGCTSAVQLKPAEVAKFSGAREQHATTIGYGFGYGTGWGLGRGAMLGGPTFGVASVVPDAHVETTDGRIEAIPATSPFEIVFTDGSVRRFTPPVDARVEGDSLIIASNDHPREAYALAAIRHAEVRKIHAGKTFALMLGGTLGFFGTAALAALALR